jgi:hypothetical protein
MLLYGGVAAILFAIAVGVVVPFPYTMSGSRIVQLRETTAALNAGAPPLLQLHGRQYEPAGPTDDQGGYVLVPVVAHVVGTMDVKTVMKWCYIAGFVLLVVASPFVFGRLFGTWEAAAVAPWAMALFGASAFDSDFYWPGPWALGGLLPLVLIVDTRRTRRPLVLLTVAMVGASFASAIRSQAGLPVVLAALAVTALMHEWSRRRRLVIALVAVLCYVSITPLGMAGLRAYRNHWTGIPHFGATATTSHPFWHNAYIGFGYLPNTWQIRWRDSVAEAAVQRVRPGTQYVSAEYESILRRLWLNVVKDEPGFAARQVAEKAVVVVNRSFPYWFFLAAVLPFLWPRLRRDTRERRWALLLLPAFLLPLVEPLITVPYRQYTLHLFGGLGVASLLIVCGSASSVFGYLERRRRGDGRLQVARGAKVASIVGVVVVAALFLAGQRIQSRAATWISQPAKPAPLP